MKKVFSKVGISFKGDGFYKNDHGANASSRRTPTPRESSSSSSSSSKVDIARTPGRRRASSTSSKSESSSSSTDPRLLPRTDSNPSDPSPASGSPSDARSPCARSRATRSGTLRAWRRQLRRSRAARGVAARLGRSRRRAVRRSRLARTPAMPATRMGAGGHCVGDHAPTRRPGRSSNPPTSRRPRCRLDCGRAMPWSADPLRAGGSAHPMAAGEILREGRLVDGGRGEIAARLEPGMVGIVSIEIPADPWSWSGDLVGSPRLRRGRGPRAPRQPVR